jgi:prophage antirepressor-like protein
MSQEFKNFDIGGHKVRGYKDSEDIWFVAKDLTKALNLSANFFNSSRKVKLLDHQFAMAETAKCHTAVRVVNVKTLLTVVLKGKKHEAKGVREWAYSLLVPYFKLRIPELPEASSAR